MHLALFAVFLDIIIRTEHRKLANEAAFGRRLLVLLIAVAFCMDNQLRATAVLVDFVVLLQHRTTANCATRGRPLTVAIVAAVFRVKYKRVLPIDRCVKAMRGIELRSQSRGVGIVFFQLMIPTQYSASALQTSPRGFFAVIFVAL